MQFKTGKAEIIETNIIPPENVRVFRGDFNGTDIGHGGEIMGKKVRISQCMIVKNEEKNIQKALSWGKDVVYEQVVVDTGSTDRTVEMAEQMGAKIYYYEWHDDFAAAKNYALNQASGDWIAFLDADEYFTQEDARQLKKFLEDLIPQKRNPDLLTCPWLQLNDEGKVFSTAAQQRIFRNVPWIRYKNRIHEILIRKDGKPLSAVNVGNHFPIYHTGYAQSAYEETKKTTRNKEILLKILEENPEDYDNLSYLGDVYFADGEKEKAKEVYQKVIAHPKQVYLESRRNMAFCTLMRMAAQENAPDAEAGMRELYASFEETGAQCPDMEFWMGMCLMNKLKFQDGVYWLELALQKLEKYRGDDVLFMTGELERVYVMLAQAHKELGNLSEVVRYCTIVLGANKKQEKLLILLLQLLEADEGTTVAAAYQFLQKLYNFSDMKDKLFVLKQAKLAPYLELEEELLRSMTEEEKKWLEENTASWQLTVKELEERYPQIPISNQVDYRFLTLLECICQLSEDELMNRMRTSLDEMRRKDEAQYELFLNCFRTFPIWGELSPSKGNYDVFTKRANALTEHREEFLWLYTALSDNRSRQTLYSIVENWIHLEKQVLEVVRDSGIPYFDLDIIPSCNKGIFADVGVGNGKSVTGFLYYYGEEYQRIYCFESNVKALEALKAQTEGYENIILEECEPESIKIDETISDKIDLIKINVPGSAVDALNGCERHIKEEHPKLAICTDFMYEDIWKIPKMITEMDSSYKFYMRYYGENLIPTKFVLYAV